MGFTLLGAQHRIRARSQSGYMPLCVGLPLLIVLLAACDSAAPTSTPSRILSGPTLAASPTVAILTSEELYGTSVAFGGDGQNNSTSAPLPSRGGLPPIIRATAINDLPAQIEIFLEDQTSVLGDLYSTGDALLRGPGLLLIGTENSVWGDMANQARAAGISVLVITLRVTPAPTDLGSLLTALSELPTVDPSRLGVVVQGEITDRIFAQCATQPLCDFAALIGPRNRDALVSTFSLYQPRPLLLVAGENDAASTAAAVALASAAPQTTTRLITRVALDENVLQSDSALMTELVAWISTTLVAIPDVLPTIERQ